MKKLVIQIEERVPLAGYVYWRDARGEGRFFWTVRKNAEKKRSGDGIELHPSWGAPMDATFAELKKKLIAYVTNADRPKALIGPARG